jgi:hypothetical protein
MYLRLPCGAWVDLHGSYACMILSCTNWYGIMPILSNAYAASLLPDIGGVVQFSTNRAHILLRARDVRIVCIVYKDVIHCTS